MWKNYAELEDALSMPELTAILVAKRKSEHNERKFLAALQGHDLGDGPEEKKQVTFDDIKARVFSGGQAKDASDILALQGINAAQAGFGIGMGLEYTDAKDLENPSW
jgi:hypothetical protein